MKNPLTLLWKFGRPHTIIGSALSITTLYLLAAQEPLETGNLTLYFVVLISALACNVFITGLNQIVDLEIDIINKPFLPIAAGELSLRSAKTIVKTCLLISLLLAAFVSWEFLVLISLIAIIGVAYSVPPIRLKKHHLPAAICIVFVRGILVNLGIGLIFEFELNQTFLEDSLLVPLTVFVSVFSVAIAWFKDLYDVDGDKEFNVRTLAALYNVKLAYTLGNGMVVLAFLYVIGSTWHNHIFIAVGHIVLLTLYLLHVATSSVSSREKIYKFYIRFWVFFFAEYLLYILYSVIGW